MKTGNWDYVYLTRDTYADCIRVWNTNIGIVKYRGCAFFRSARSLGKRGVQWSRSKVGQLDWGGETRKQFGFIPRPDTAWLVNTTTLERKRIDKDMALIDPATGKVVG